MATQEVERNSEDVADKPAKDFVSDEMVEAAKASAKARNDAVEADTSGVGVLRKKGGGANSRLLKPSDIPYPVEVHGENFEFYGPTGFGAVIPEGVDVAEFASEQEFVIDPERVRTLFFDKPGRNLPKKRLYNIKGLHKDGRLNQFPFEPQIQNNAGGDPEDAIGLRRYQRKGIFLFIDWNTLIPVYCAAWDCWAAGQAGGNFAGFCALRHAQHTLPNAYKGGGEISRGLMEAGVTTTNVWST
jgi:hypothetical protein